VEQFSIVFTERLAVWPSYLPLNLPSCFSASGDNFYGFIKSQSCVFIVQRLGGGHAFDYLSVRMFEYQAKSERSCEHAGANNERDFNHTNVKDYNRSQYNKTNSYFEYIHFKDDRDPECVKTEGNKCCYYT